MTQVQVDQATHAEGPQVPAAIRSEAPAEAVRAQLHRARQLLLAGRGPGASEAEIAAHTRNRVEIAGVTTTRRLELTARRTAVARGDTDAMVSVIQLSRAELADILGQLRSRLHPRHLVGTAARGLTAQLRAHPAPLVLGVGAVVVLRGRRRAARGEHAGPTG